MYTLQALDLASFVYSVCLQLKKAKTGWTLSVTKGLVGRVRGGGYGEILQNIVW